MLLIDLVTGLEHQGDQRGGEAGQAPEHEEAERVDDHRAPVHWLAKQVEQFRVDEGEEECFAGNGCEEG